MRTRRGLPRADFRSRTEPIVRVFIVVRLGRVDNSLVNLRRLGNQLGGILEPFVLVIILS